MGGYGGGGYGMQGGQQQEQMMMSSSFILVCCCIIAGVVLWMYSTGKLGGGKETPSPERTEPPSPTQTDAPVPVTSEGCAASMKNELLGNATPPFDPAKCTTDTVPWQCSYWEVKDVLGTWKWNKVPGRNVPECAPQTVIASDTKNAVYNRIKSIFPVFTNDMQVDVALQFISMSQYRQTDWSRTFGVQNTQWDIIQRTTLTPVKNMVDGLRRAFNTEVSPLSIAFMIDTAWGGQVARLTKLIAQFKVQINMQEKLWLETLVINRHTYYAFKSVHMWKALAANPAFYYLNGINVKQYAIVA